jgi:hypothetical protein
MDWLDEYGDSCGELVRLLHTCTLSECVTLRSLLETVQGC